MKQDNCVFCGIIDGIIPSSKIYEDEKVLAFMGIRPVHDGECMVIPKEHIDHFMDIPDELASHVISIAQKIAHKIMDAYHPKRVGYIVHGFGVPHAHLILIPLHEVDEITSSAFAYLENGKIQFSEGQIPIQDRDKLDTIASMLTI